MPKCPICGNVVDTFLTIDTGASRRIGAVCPSCRSLERHRVLWLYLERETDFFSKPRTVLHFSPEACLESRLRALFGERYRTVDLSSPGADIVADIRSLPIAGNSIHFILCSHVLEHVENDASALRELLRVLVPEGVALILVPTRPGSKFENPEITAAGPESRLKHYGHPDHVRWYGDDTRDWFASLRRGSTAKP